MLRSYVSLFSASILLQVLKWYLKYLKWCLIIFLITIPIAVFIGIVIGVVVNTKPFAEGARPGQIARTTQNHVGESPSVNARYS